MKGETMSGAAVILLLCLINVMPKDGYFGIWALLIAGAGLLYLYGQSKAKKERRAARYRRSMQKGVR